MAASEKLKALQAAMDKIEKSFGKGSIMKMGDESVEQVEVIPTGSIGLNVALGVGGYPRGRIIEIYGPESSGKTTLAIHAIAEAQKAGGIAAFIDAEHAFDRFYAAKLGVDVDNLLISQPDNGEQALEIAEQLIRSSAIDIIVVDSVAALTPKAEIEGDMGDNKVGLQARLMSQALRKLTSAVSKTRTTCIFINQLREKIGVMFGNPETTTGGNALKFYASVRLDIRGSQAIKNGEEVIGKQTKVKVVKNKVAPPFRRAEFDIMFGEGISRAGEIIDLGAELGIVKKSGSWFSYNGSKIGQGRDNAKEFLRQNPELAEEIALGFDISAEKEEKVDVIEELLKEEEEDESTMVSRPPVVCVMGHVDHGKTSLLDAIRKTNVTRGEAGGITQHIGAYVVDINGQKITFLDTPGHEAFTAMRMRGANSTDIAVLVVAADDGVMPQTVEAISHAKAAGVEIIVAINKIDKPSANIERVKQELSEYELIPEDWGGTTPFVPVSAKTGEGIDDLLEMILLTAEVSELKANPNRAARGLVIEAQLDKGKGPVATILVQKGTLHVGDFIAAGACSGKVRAMMDDKGRRVKQAGPSTPVEILGLGDVPNAGEVLMSFENDKEAKNFAAAFVSENKNRLLEETKGKLSLDNLFDQIQASDLKELPIIVKADVQGSVEAVKQSLVKLSNEEVVVRVIHGGVGAINESDVSLAATSNAIIIGFNVRPDTTAKQLAEQEGVDLRLYKVIYQAIEDVEAAMKGMLDPVFEEKVIGHAEVRQLFKASGVGTIAGSYVLDGTFQRGCKVRISRGEDQIYEGELASLKRFKDDVKEVRAGYECGLVFQDFNDVKEEDKVEAYIMVEVPR